LISKAINAQYLCHVQNSAASDPMRPVSTDPLSGATRW